MKEKWVRKINFILACSMISVLFLSTSNSLAVGNTDPSAIYNGGYSLPTQAPSSHFGLAQIPGMDVYCMEPGSALDYSADATWAEIESHARTIHTRSGCYAEASCPMIGKKSEIRVFAGGTYDLPPAAAYILSSGGDASWSGDKQIALWYTRDEGLGLMIGDKDYSHDPTPGSQALLSEGMSYGSFAAIAQGPSGPELSDALGGGKGTIQYLESEDAYVARSFKLNYTNGETSTVTFGGLSDMYLIGYNRFGDQVKTIPIERINITNANGTIDRTIQGSDLEFFTPEGENDANGEKIDRTAQNYPKSGEGFEVVYKNPNVGIDNNDEENRVITVTLKVKYKYMTTKATYTELKLKKIHIAEIFHHFSNHYCHGIPCYVHHHRDDATHSLVYTDQQTHMAVNIEREVHEKEIDVRPGGPDDPDKPGPDIIPDMSMQIGGRVWVDMQIGKEGAGWDGEYKGENTNNTLRAETLVNPDNEGEFANDVDKLVKGVEVQLFEQVNGVINPDPIAITVTDEDGKYIFYGLDLAKKYTLKFVYNGLMFQTTTYNPDLKGNHSNITEQQADRDAFNQNFAEIASYPNNYPVRVELFKAPGEYNQSWSIEKLTQKDDSLYYQWIDKACEIVKQQREQDKFKPVKDGTTPVSPFVLAARELGTSDELKSQLQFLMDSRIDAWTGNNANLENQDGLKFYPEIPDGYAGVTPLSREEADDPTTGTFYTGDGQKTIALYDGVDFDDSEIIDLKVGNTIYRSIRRTYVDNREKIAEIDSVLRIDGGLTWRPQFDVSLKKDLYKATLKINGKTQVYTYNSRNITAGDGDLEGNQSPSLNGRTYKDTTWDIEIRKQEGYYNNPKDYQREIFKTDYDYRRTDYNSNSNRDRNGLDASDIIQGLKEGSELEIYVTYKIGIRNQSQNIRGAITEIVDYYDESYIYEPNLSFATWADDTTGEKVSQGELGEVGDGIAEIFAKNKINKNEFEQGMKQEFKIEGEQTYFAENRQVIEGKTLRDYLSSTEPKAITGKQDSKYQEPGSQQPIDGYQSLYVTGFEDKQLDAGESLYVYLTFRVRKQGDNRDIDLSKNGEGEGKENTAEINGYKTFYKEGTTLANYAGTNNYATPANIPAGLIDKDSTPGNITKPEEIANPEEYFEDDTDKAPGLRLIRTEEDIRKLNGMVWEDNRNENSGEAVVGNGKKDPEEPGIEGVKVQFIEVIQTQKDGEDYVESVWKNTNTDANGFYEFAEYIPGNYYVKFTYGDGKETVIASENLIGNEGQNPVTNLVGGGNSNKRSYNGHDYKSTTYQTGVNQGDGYYTGPTPFIRGQQVNGYTDYGNSNGTYGGAQNEIATYIYDIGTMDKEENKGRSDAKDIGSLRDLVVNYSKNNVRNHVAEVLASPYKVPVYDGQPYTVEKQEELLNELMRETQMSAISGVMDIELEYNRTQSFGDDSNTTVGNNGEYIHEGLDLGLEERPEAQLTVNKKVYEIDVKDSTGKPLFNSQNLSPVANLVWLPNTENHVSTDNRLLKQDFLAEIGLLQPTVDEEYMRGMVITLTYQITIKNDGEVDYIESEFYYTGENGREKSKTQVNNMIDYVDLNLRYVQNGNDAWRMVEGSQNANDYTTALISGNNGLLNEKLREFVDNDFEQIIQLRNAREESVPGDLDTITLVLSQTITAEDLESATDANGNILEDSKLNFDNLVELVETSNTLGRRMEFSVVGNQQPNINPTEIDTAKSESVIVMGPYGTRAPTLYAVLGISICAILIGGVVLIKKKVLK